MASVNVKAIVLYMAAGSFLASEFLATGLFGAAFNSSW